MIPLVCGIKDVNIQRKLFIEPKLGFKRACEIALVAEEMQKNIDRKIFCKFKRLIEINKTENVFVVESIMILWSVSIKIKCFHCGRKGHIKQVSFKK